MKVFPAITADKLLPFKQIAQHLAVDPGYMDDPLCPYSPETKNWLKRIFVKVEDAVVVGVEAEDDGDWKDVAAKARKLYVELEAVKAEVGKADTSERIALAKAQAGLLERLIAVGDRALGHKAVADQLRVLFEAVESVMSPDQRTELMDKLKEYR